MAYSRPTCAPGSCYCSLLTHHASHLDFILEYSAKCFLNLNSLTRVRCSVKQYGRLQWLDMSSETLFERSGVTGSSHSLHSATCAWSPEVLATINSLEITSNPRPTTNQLSWFWIAGLFRNALRSFRRTDTSRTRHKLLPIVIKQLVHINA